MKRFKRKWIQRKETMKLNKDDQVAIYEIGNAKSSIIFDDKKVNFDRVKLSRRDGKPTKLRL